MIIAIIYLLIGFAMAILIIKEGGMDELIEEDKQFQLGEKKCKILYGTTFVLAWPLIILAVILLWKKF